MERFASRELIDVEGVVTGGSEVGDGTVAVPGSYVTEGWLNRSFVIDEYAHWQAFDFAWEMPVCTTRRCRYRRWYRRSPFERLERRIEYALEEARRRMVVSARCVAKGQCYEQ